VRVHLAGEHALEFELRDLAFQAAHVLLDRLDGALVGLGLCQLEQFPGFRDPAAQPVERPDDRFELGALAAEFLRPLRLLPDGGILEFPQDLGEALAAALVVKDTP